MCLLLFYVLAADNSPTHVLVEFIGDECVGVVPVHHILHCDVNNLGSGDKVTVIWDDKREYSARFILSGLSSARAIVSFVLHVCS